MRIIDVVQGTDEWKAARCGKVTGSRLKDVLAKVKSGEAASRRDYRVELVCEILTGVPAELGFISKEMQHGTDNEPFARAAYEAETGAMVDQVGFAVHPSISRAGASPDGIIGWDGEGDPEGILEIKAPKTATHLGYILTALKDPANAVPADYQPQMLWQMACTGAQWCDFVSFDPRLPEDLQLFVQRFPRDDARIASMEMEVRAFLREVDETITNLRKIRPAA